MTMRPQYNQVTEIAVFGLFILLLGFIARTMRDTMVGAFANKNSTAVLPATEPLITGHYEYSVRIPVTYRQASTSAGRRYVRERMAEVRRRILEKCPDAKITSGMVIGTLDVKCSRPLIARDLGRGVEVTSWASTTLPAVHIYTAEEIFARAKEYFGTTANPKEAGYILPDGTMLDFSGRKFNGEPGRRIHDHREITFAWPEDDSPGGLEGMKRIMNYGAVRFAMYPETIAIDTVHPLTEAQKNTITRALRLHPDAVLVVEVSSPDLMDTVYRNFFYPFINWKAFIENTLAVRRMSPQTSLFPKTHQEKVQQAIESIQQAIDETRKADSIQRIERILDKTDVERYIVGADDLREAIADYKAITRVGLTPEEYIDEKEAAFEAIAEAVEGLDVEEVEYGDEIKRITGQYGHWATRLAEAVCPHRDIACIEKEARRLIQSQARR